MRLEDFGQVPDDDAQDGAQPYKTSQAKAAADRAIVEGQIAEQAAGRATGASRSQAAMVGLSTIAKSLQRQAANLGKNSAAGPQGQGDEFSVSFVTVPTEMDIEDKGFRTANELTAAFPFQDMPLDPRIMRECRVEAWIGTVTVGDFATADKWHLKPEISKTSILRFNGYIDLPEMEHDENEGVLHIKARSYESVLIDGKKITEPKYPVGLMDIVSEPLEKKYYRMELSGPNLVPKPISAEAAARKYLKVANKHTVKGAKTAITFHDGRNYLGDKHIKTGDTCVFSVPEFKLLVHIKLAPGADCLVVEGKHRGERAKLEKIIERPGSHDSEVLMSGPSGQFITVTKYLFPIDGNYA